MTQIYDLLQQDHRKVEQILQQLATSEKEQGQQLVSELKQELDIHTQFEEELFYPEIRAATGMEDDVDDAEQEHQEARAMVESLMNGLSQDEWQETVQSLTQAIKHHVKEEEDEIFPAARQKIDDTIAEDLGEQYAAFKRGDVDAALEE